MAGERVPGQHVPGGLFRLHASTAMTLYLTAVSACH